MMTYIQKSNEKYMCVRMWQKSHGMEVVLEKS